jgi:hypothetical protein
MGSVVGEEELGASRVSVGQGGWVCYAVDGFAMLWMGDGARTSR